MIKMRLYAIRLVLAGFFVFVLCLAWSPLAQNQQQSKDKLVDKKKLIESEIAYYKKLIDETKKNKNTSVNQLVLLKNQISKRESLIGEINSEISQLDGEISKNNYEVEKSIKHASSLKEEYARMIYYNYKNKSNISKLMFLFGSKDFNQAHKRLRYLQNYNDYLQQRVRLINLTNTEIIKRNQELILQKRTKKELLISSEQEKKQLAVEKAKKDEDVKKLKLQEADLRKKLKQKEEEARVLKRKIESAISDAMHQSAKKSNKTVTTTTTVKTVLTPEEKIESDNFAGNKGRLPWPVERGAISSTFGEHPHPVLDGIRIKNNGVDIATTSNSSARAIFKGVVTGIATITNQNMAVIIRHGDFFTVYSNLRSVSVTKGQQVNSKQIIGVVNTSPEDNKTEIHFEIWQGNTLCNPQSWITSR